MERLTRQAFVEACVDSVASAMAARSGGAGRLELCDSLSDGGTTPSAGMIAAVKARVEIPVFVIIRPRGGGFVYSNDEIDVMRRDVAIARAQGADGFALGAVTPAAAVDLAATRSLVEAAAGLPVTFHRAFDMVLDRDAALDDLVRAGVQRILTAGGAANALEGVEEIKRLIARAAGRLTVMAGGGIREQNALDVVRGSGASEIHVRLTRVRQTPMMAGATIKVRRALPADEAAWEEFDESRLRELIETLRRDALS